MISNCYEESLIRNSRLPSEWQSQAALDELADFLQQNWAQRFAFYDDSSVSSKQQFLEFGGQKSVKTKNYIGTIVFRGHQLNIFPKMFRTEKDDYDTGDLTLPHLMKNLVNWIEYCDKFNYPYMSITSDLDDSNDLRELFISLYVRYVRNALDRGLFYRYEEETEDCASIKGKFDIKDYYVRKIPNGLSDKFQCTYSNFEFDNMLNRVIKYTCKELMSETSIGNQRIIRHILMKLNEVSDVNCKPHDCDTIRLSRLHQHYNIILSMSKMFLLNKTSSYNVDDTESFCFLFPTEVLFEGFIGGYMRSVLSDDAKVTLQASQLSLISDILYAGRSLGESFKMRHDILVEHKEKGMFILDTKYKQISRFEGSEDLKAQLTAQITSTDLYQVLEYAVSRGLGDVYLLYPLYRYEENEPTYPTMKREVTVGGVKYIINVHPIRLPFIFEEDIDATKNNLRTVINSIF